MNSLVIVYLHSDVYILNIVVLHLSLNERKLRLSHFKGIIPLRTFNLFARALSPTLFLFDMDFSSPNKHLAWSGATSGSGSGSRGCPVLSDRLDLILPMKTMSPAYPHNLSISTEFPKFSPCISLSLFTFLISGSLRWI